MKFIPYEHIKIKSPLTVDEALAKLNDVVEPRENLRWLGSTHHKPYEGKIEGFDFHVSRAIHYRNSFLPHINGKIQSENDGCSIRLTMYPHLLVLVFMLYWLGAVGFIFFAFLYGFVASTLQSNKAEPRALFITGGMFAFGYALLIGGFKVESEISKPFFQKLFQAKETEEIAFINLRKAG